MRRSDTAAGIRQPLCGPMSTGCAAINIVINDWLRDSAMDRNGIRNLTWGAVAAEIGGS